jgi:hypothetical protein
MRRMVLLPVEGDSRMVRAGDDYDDLVRIIGGGIERVRVAVDMSMCIDGDGIRKGLPINGRASILYGTLRHGSPIVGPALVGVEGFVKDGVDWVDDPDVVAKVAALFRERRNDGNLEDPPHGAPSG